MLKMTKENITISGKKRLLEILEVLKNNNVLEGIDPKKLKKILEELGPTFIKAGQILSNRPDLLPQSYIKELETLRSNVNPMSYQEVLDIIIKNYFK